MLLCFCSFFVLRGEEGAGSILGAPHCRNPHVFKDYRFGPRSLQLLVLGPKRSAFHPRTKVTNLKVQTLDTWNPMSILAMAPLSRMPTVAHMRAEFPEGPSTISRRTRCNKGILIMARAMYSSFEALDLLGLGIVGTEGGVI